MLKIFKHLLGAELIREHFSMMQMNKKGLDKFGHETSLPVNYDRAIGIGNGNNAVINTLRLTGSLLYSPSMTRRGRSLMRHVQEDT